MITASDGKEYAKKDKKYLGLLNYVKSDPSFVSNNSKTVKYTEKKIQEDIFKYNKTFEGRYPVAKYTEKSKYSFDFIAGIPIIPLEGITYFRAGIFINKTLMEKTRKKSISRGITYIDRNDNNAVDGSISKGSVGYREQILNILPLGIKLHADKKVIQPYFYFGIGLAAVLSSGYTIDDYQIVDSSKKFGVIPTISIRVGTEIKIGSKAIILELNPGGFETIFLNLGFSF
jgi:hypothetical protein